MAAVSLSLSMPIYHADGRFEARNATMRWTNEPDVPSGTGILSNSCARLVNESIAALVPRRRRPKMGLHNRNVPHSRRLPRLLRTRHRLLYISLLPMRSMLQTDQPLLIRSLNTHPRAMFHNINRLLNIIRQIAPEVPDTSLRHQRLIIKNRTTLTRLNIRLVICRTSPLHNRTSLRNILLLPVPINQMVISPT